MKWNEYNAAVSASTESARTDSHRRAAPETLAAENKKPNRTRNNKITVYLSDAELARLNAMVDKTVMNREQFIRTMIEGNAACSSFSDGPYDEECSFQFGSDIQECISLRTVG